MNVKNDAIDFKLVVQENHASLMQLLVHWVNFMRK
jgi:hypothetical protein